MELRRIGCDLRQQLGKWKCDGQTDYTQEALSGLDKPWLENKGEPISEVISSDEDWNLNFTGTQQGDKFKRLGFGRLYIA